MHTDTAPVAGPSKRSYAQVLKDVPPPHKKFNTNAPQDCADDWTDVSSVSSCDWPGSVDEECMLLCQYPPHGSLTRLSTTAVSTDEQCTPIRDQRHDEQRYYPGPETINSVPWVDDDVDTRASHAMASHIKYTNRSRWRYTNIPVSPGLQGVQKPWRRYPGAISFIAFRVTTNQGAPGTRNLSVDNYQRQEMRKESRTVSCVRQWKLEDD